MSHDDSSPQQDARVETIKRYLLHPPDSPDLLRQEMFHLLQGLLPELTHGQIQDFHLKQLSGAMTNVVFYAQFMRTKNSSETSLTTRRTSFEVIVRLYGEGSESFIERQRELLIYQTLSKMPEMHLGLLACFPQGRVETFLRGTVGTFADLRKPVVFTRIARALAMLHTFDLSHVIDARPHQLETKLQKFLGQIQEKGCCGCTWISGTTLESYVDTFVSLLAARPHEDHHVVFCHGDLQYGNVMIQEDHEVALIDFEYSGYYPRAFDLANHFCEWMYDYHKPEGAHVPDIEAFPSSSEQREFCQHYLSTPSDELDDLVADIQVYLMGVHLFWGMWGILQSQQSDIDFNFQEYAQCRFQMIETMLYKSSH